MSANPFGERVSAFLESRHGCLTEEYIKNLGRRFRRIENDLKRLKDDGKVKTLSPGKLTEEDVKEFITYRKGRKVCAGDISHDIAALQQLCSFCDNAAVQKCILKYPGLKPKVNQVMLEPLSEETYNRILTEYNSERINHDSLEQIRPYVMVLTYVSTGARNKELRLARFDDLDVNDWIIHYEHVKGEDTWGEPRDVAIPDFLQPILENYIRVRYSWCINHRIDPAGVEPLFFSLNKNHDYLSANSVRKIKSRVESSTGTNFQLRDCRRAFGQHYKDNDLPMEDISRAMGHKSTRTTEAYYCRKRQSEVIKNMRGKW